VKRIVWASFLAAIAIAFSAAWMRGPVTAQSTGPEMQVTVGFDGYCRSGNSGGWCPVYIVLSNEGADIEGELIVPVSGAGGDRNPNLYARSVVLPAHSRKAYFLYIASAGSFARSRLTVQLVAGETLASEGISVSWLDERNRLYGVASSNPSALNFLSDVAPSGGAAVAHLALEALPPDPLGWEGLDVLVLSDVDTTVLTGAQRRALEAWLAHGGHLIVGGGAGAARTVAGVEDLLPVTVGGVHPVDDLWALGERVGALTVEGPYAVAEAALKTGEVLIAQEEGDDQSDIVLWARRPYGAGKVDFLAFDAGLNPFARWEDNGELWELIVGVQGAGARRFTVSNGYGAREAVNAIPGLELPTTLQLLAFMLAYTILIGPLNYVLLRKLDRRELAWVTIPVLILGFTVCAYVTGFQIRGLTAIVHRLSVVYVPEGAGIGRVSGAVGIFSPRRATYDVWVADAGVREISGDFYGGPARQPLHVVVQGEGVVVTGLRVDVGGIQPFIAEGYVDVSTVASGLQLSVSESGALQVSGTLRNGGVALHDAVLIAGDHEQRLGDLEAGGEASVQLLYRHQGGGQGGTPEQILGPGSYWEDRELYRRYQFLQALFPYDGQSGLLLGRGVYLVGWADQVPQSVEVVGRPFTTIETVLYVYSLPVEGLGTGTTVTIPPGLITRQVEETVGEVSMWPEGFHMGPGSEVEFRFTVWPGLALGEVDELVLDLQGSSYGGRVPAVSLWNEESSEWERQDIGWGTHSIPDAQAYVLPPGDVLVRLEAGAEWPADVQNLTVTIKGQR